MSHRMNGPRCYGCCQENCGRTNCSCSCHDFGCHDFGLAAQAAQVTAELKPKPAPEDKSRCYEFCRNGCQYPRCGCPCHENEKVNHPSHYGGDTVYEAIKVIEAWGLNFSLGSTIKYICRAGKKPGEAALDDLRKARWYLDREIKRREEDSQ